MKDEFVTLNQVSLWCDAAVEMLESRLAMIKIARACDFKSLCQRRRREVDPWCVFVCGAAVYGQRDSLQRGEICGNPTGTASGAARNQRRQVWMDLPDASGSLRGDW